VGGGSSQVSKLPNSYTLMLVIQIIESFTTWLVAYNDMNYLTPQYDLIYD